MGENINDRLKELIEVHLQISAYEFSKSLGNDRPDNIYNNIKEEKPTAVSPKTIEKILKAYPDLRRAWLLDGEMPVFKEGGRQSVTGKQLKSSILSVYTAVDEAAQMLGIAPDVLKSEFKKAEVDKTILNDVVNKLGILIKGYSLNESRKPGPATLKQLKSVTKEIPVYSDKAAASAVEIYNDESGHEPAFFVSIPQFADCDFGKMIFGHSMYPTYENGSYAFMRRIGNAREVAPGEVYYIETTYLKVVKRLQFGNLGHNDDHFMAFSDNDEKRTDGGLKYEPFPIFKQDILALFLVKGAIKQNQN